MSHLRVAIEEGRRPEEVASDWLRLTAQREVDDPLLKLLGSLESETPDLGERHDHYLSDDLMKDTGRKVKAEVFADTSGWLNAFVHTEPQHAAAAEYLRKWQGSGHGLSPPTISLQSSPPST